MNDNTAQYRSVSLNDLFHDVSLNNINNVISILKGNKAHPMYTVVISWPVGSIGPVSLNDLFHDVSLNKNINNVISILKGNKAHPMHVHMMRTVQMQHSYKTRLSAKICLTKVVIYKSEKTGTIFKPCKRYTVNMKMSDVMSEGVRRVVSECVKVL